MVDNQKINSFLKYKIIISILAVLCLILFIYIKNEDHIKPKKSFMTQADFVEDLANDTLNLDDPKEVFRYLFNQLSKEVTIYQSENNLYLKFAAHGTVFGGIITLSILDRDDGVISLSYIERNEDPNIPQKRGEFMGGGKSFTAEDGMFVKKIDDWTYKVTFEKKTVIFHLYNPGMNPPVKAKLLPSEEYVGPEFDEAGIELYLLFNNDVSRLYLILNEDRYVRDQFRIIDGDIFIGERTGFAFYDDKENNRKILIGVKGENTLQNNWYDGPHDQVPDNYVHYGFIPKYLEYLEAQYPEMKGKMDKYGHFIGQEGGRIALAPYLVYFSEQEIIDVVRSCKKINQTKSKFYDCLTLQVFSVPEDKQYLLGY